MEWILGGIGLIVTVVVGYFTIIPVVDRTRKEFQALQPDARLVRASCISAAGSYSAVLKVQNAGKTPASDGTITLDGRPGKVELGTLLPVRPGFNEYEKSIEIGQEHPIRTTRWTPPGSGSGTGISGATLMRRHTPFFSSAAITGCLTSKYRRISRRWTGQGHLSGGCGRSCGRLRVDRVAAVGEGSCAGRREGLVMADNAPEVVEAQRFVLRDRDGWVRVILTTGREGDDLPRFSTEPLDPWGKPLIGTDGNPALLFLKRGEKATLRARLAMGPGGWPELDLGDEEGRLRVRLLVNNVGQAVLLFLDDADRSSAELEWSSDSGPKLRIGDLVMDAAYARFLRWLPALVGAALFASLAPLVTRLF